VEEKVFVVTRSFQAGTGKGGKEFNPKIFEEGVACPIRQLLEAKNVKTIIVVVNAEKGNRLAELPDNTGTTPTMCALQDNFHSEIGLGKIIVSLCTNWGPNPGSATALNQGLSIVQSLNHAGWILNWSPEIEMNGSLIDRALVHAERHNLSVVGFLRQNWWERPQWTVVQNTAALWDIETLLAIKGFSAECNGTGRTVVTKEYGKVALAGMEDFHALLRILKERPLRWGMVGRSNPLLWDTNFEPGSQRLDNHLKKIARQYQVMQAYVQDIWPSTSFNLVMNEIFARCYID